MGTGELLGKLDEMQHSILSRGELLLYAKETGTSPC